MEHEVVLGISARHMHLNRKDMDALFGEGSELHAKSPLKQPGQYASQEQLIMVTAKGETKLRVLGPIRSYTQIELSLTDARKAGVTAPIRKSGDLEGTPGCILKTLDGSKQIEISKGIIIAGRHVHLCPATAAKLGLKENDHVDLVTTGERACTLHNVLVRSSVKDADEVHLDTDEGNAINMGNDQMVTIRTL